MVEKGKGKGKKGKGTDKDALSLSKAEQLLDLNSSWDSTAQTSPGISSFAKDTSQILKPLKPVLEEGAEPSSAPARKARSPTPPKPKPRSASVSPEPSDPQESAVRKYSVARLSELFDRGMSPVESKGWSSSIRPAASPSPVNHTPSPTPKSSTAEPAPEGGAAPPSPGTKYEVMYGYQAADDTEVTVVEGDVVTFVPRADASTGWMMVRVEGGAEGWVPESYLQLQTRQEGVVSDGGVVSEGEKESDDSVAKETGQVIKEQESPAQPSSKAFNNLSSNVHTYVGASTNMYVRT